MIKIALTGNIGCGKSTVAKLFKELGAYTVDADSIIRGFYRKEHTVYREVLRQFGAGILDEKGNIDRKKLADIVFKDRDKLKILESITHGALYKELDRIYKKLPPSAVIVVEASLLIEKGTYKNYDYTVVVYAPYQTCRERALSRGMNPEDFERRWKNQMPIEEKVKYADFVIDNSGDIEETKEQVRQIWEKITGGKVL